MTSLALENSEMKANTAIFQTLPAEYQTFRSKDSDSSKINTLVQKM